jgi:negative regulator of sigma E activity
MDNAINQNISCFFDDELDRHKTQALLNILHTDVDLRHKLERYQVVRSALSSKKHFPIKKDFLQGIQESIANEPLYLCVPPKKSHNTLIALAACIGMVTVIGFSTLYHQSSKINTMSSPDKLAKHKTEKINLHVQNTHVNNGLKRYNNNLYPDNEVRISAYTQTARYQKK